MKLDPGAVRRILVLRYRSIGDIILSNPALAGLRRMFPAAKIHMVVDDVFEDVLYGNPNVDKIILSPRKPSGPKWKADIAMINKLRAAKYDLAVDLHGGPRSSWFTLFSGARWRIGHGFRWRNRLCYNMAVPTPDFDDHTWRVQYRVVNALGSAWPEKPEFFLNFPEKAMESARAKVGETGFNFDMPIVLLHPGARIQVKRWPAEKMGALARWLVDEKGAAVFLAGSKADEEEIKSIRRAAGYALPYFTNLNVGELAALIKMANLIVCNDSGPMHMAGALNTPILALFGPSDPKIWEPMGADVKATITGAPMECMPCDQKGCPYEGAHCMTRIELGEVKRELEKLLPPHA